MILFTSKILINLIIFTHERRKPYNWFYAKTLLMLYSSEKDHIKIKI